MENKIYSMVEMLVELREDSSKQFRRINTDLVYSLKNNILVCKNDLGTEIPSSYSLGEAILNNDDYIDIEVPYYNSIKHGEIYYFVRTDCTVGSEIYEQNSPFDERKKEECNIFRTSKEAEMVSRKIQVAEREVRKNILKGDE